MNLNEFLDKILLGYLQSEVALVRNSLVGKEAST